MNALELFRKSIVLEARKQKTIFKVFGFDMDKEKAKQEEIYRALKRRISKKKKRER